MNPLHRILAPFSKVSFIPDWTHAEDRYQPGCHSSSYARLAKYFNKDKGVAWPKIETMAGELGASTRQIDTYLKCAEGCRADRSGEKGPREIEPVSIPRPQHFCVS